MWIGRERWAHPQRTTWLQAQIKPGLQTGFQIPSSHPTTAPPQPHTAQTTHQSSTEHTHPPTMAYRSHLLRASLRTTPSNGSPSSSSLLSSATTPFILPCKKLVFEYCPSWGSNKGTIDFIAKDVEELAREYPSVEIVVRERRWKHPVLRAFYG